MLVIEGRFERTKELETKTNLIFSTKEELNEWEIIQLTGTVGYIAFNGDVFAKEVEQAMNNKSMGIIESGKSLSQIFRGVCFQIAVANDYDPEEFYRQEMEKIIQHYKQKYL